jgi:hypothetical protein
VFIAVNTLTSVRRTTGPVPIRGWPSRATAAALKEAACTSAALDAASGSAALNAASGSAALNAASGSAALNAASSTTTNHGVTNDLDCPVRLVFHRTPFRIVIKSI